MKELTIEQKAQRYDEALERARIACKDEDKHLQAALKRILPELKESGDEKIRNAIYNALKYLEIELSWDKLYNRVDILDAYAWLEKQGEKPADKVGPKFHEGDWVVKGDTIAQILDIQEQYYVGLDINGKDFTSSRFLNDDKIHLWTIQDAKEGDVLIGIYGTFIFMGESNGGYCGVLSDNTFIRSTGNNEMTKGLHPATKEQYDALLKAMADAGYTFDFENKELKKIEQSKLTEFEDAVKDMMDAYRDAIGDCDATTEEVKKHAAYMLSLIPLKPTVEWKPSEEQMDALESAVSSLQSSTLETLYQDLKREKNYE